MHYKVSLPEQDKTFSVETGESLLNAALKQKVNIPFSCRSGSCGTCKIALKSGQIHYPKGQPIGLSNSDKIEGFALACQAHVSSDLTIALPPPREHPIKTLPGRVISKKALTHDVTEFTIQLPPAQPLSYQAGQYLDILLQGGKRRSFSMATPAQDNNQLVLHIRQVPGGFFTDDLLPKLAEKSLVRVQVPLGQFQFHQDSDRPIIMIAGGTGFAPIRAILEALLSQPLERSVHLYWGVRGKRDLYQQELVKTWSDTQANFEYTAVLSEPEATEHWSGRTGFVHEAVAEDYTSLAQHDVYMCGPPIMIESGREKFIDQGLDETRLFFDSFEYAQDPVD